MSCDPEIIANNSLGSVTACSCGTITINCGNAAVRIPQEFFGRFAVLIDSAYANLAEKELSKNQNNEDNFQ